MAETSNTIKNKIVVEGEKEYKASLDQMRRSLAETKSEMRATKTEFAAQEESAQSLQAQIDVLTRQYAANESQCRTLEAYLDKTAQTFGENSREASDLRVRLNNARAAMNTTGNELGTLQKRLDAVSDASGDAGGGFDAVGESAQRAAQDVEALSSSIADAVGQKVIDFVVSGAALNALKDGIASAVQFGFGEGVDGLKERGYMQSGTGDAALTDARLAVKDEVDKRWAGRMDGMATAAAVETVDTAMDNASMSNPALVTDVTNMAIFQQERFSQSVGSQMERADAMVKAFGIDIRTAFDLMTLGYQNSHDGGTAMNEMLDKSTQLFRQMGYDADDMFSVVLSAVNDEELGKNSNLNKGMENLVKAVTDGGKEAAQALKALGLEATDIGYKAQQGGETAAAAYRLVLEQLMAIEDVDLRNQIGSALFGDSVWLNTGGDIAGALLAGFGQTIESDGTTLAAMDAFLNTIGDSWAGLQERAAQAAGGITEPLVEGANEALKALNTGIDSGDLLGGVWQAVLEWGNGLHNAIDPAIEGIAEKVREGLSGVSEQTSEAFFGGAQAGTDTQAADETARRWVDVLRGSVDSAAAETEGSGELSSMLEGMLPDTSALDTAAKAFAESHRTAVVTQLQTTYGQESDEDFAAWQAFQQAMIDSAYDGSVEQAGALGEAQSNAVLDAISAASPAAQRMGEYFGQSTVTGIESQQGNAASAGEQLGAAGSSGAEGELSDGYAIGESFGGAVAAGIRSKIESVRSAAESLSRAGSVAARTTFQIHSPSRVGLDIGENYGGAIAEGIRSRQEDVAAAGALLARAADSGTRETLPNGMDAASGARSSLTDGLSEEALERAFVRALSGVAFCIDGVEAGYLLERGVSRAGYDRAAATVSGRSAARRI